MNEFLYDINFEDYHPQYGYKINTEKLIKLLKQHNAPSHYIKNIIQTHISKRTIQPVTHVLPNYIPKPILTHTNNYPYDTNDKIDMGHKLFPLTINNTTIKPNDIILTDNNTYIINSIIQTSNKLAPRGTHLFIPSNPYIFTTGLSTIELHTHTQWCFIYRSWIKI